MTIGGGRLQSLTVSEQREQPSVSIAMATFNGERFLVEQLRSLAAQTLLPHELVVVDDCSTDSTVAILEAFATDAPFPVRILANERSLRHGPTFFRALAACDGRLVAFCDQDDVWREDKLERCADAFARDPALSMLVHAGRVVDEELNPTPVCVPRIDRTETLIGVELSPWFAHRGFAMVIPIWLRDVGDVDRRPHAFRRVEDRLMDHDEWACFLAPAVGNIALLADELAFHRRHGDNFSIMEAPGTPVPEPLRRVRGNDANLTVLRPALGGDRGMSGLFDVDVKAVAYRTMAAHCREAASYLGQLAADQDHPAWRDGMHRRTRLYARAATVHEERAAAIGGSRSRLIRLGRVLRMAVRGRYGRPSRAGIGPLSLPLDLAVASVGRPSFPDDR